MADDVVEVVVDDETVVEVVATGPQGPQGIPGVTPVTTANFDGGNAFTVPSSPNPALDLGSAT
jgi:hypothetical protein